MTLTNKSCGACSVCCKELMFDIAGTRILAGIMNYVYALDAQTGKPITTFGEGGRIDLRENLGRDPKSVMIALTSRALFTRTC